MIVQHFNYAKFKKDFYSRVTDSRPFEAEGTNFMKAVMECLVVRYALKWKIRPYIFYSTPGLFLWARRMLFRLRNKQFVAHQSTSGKAGHYNIILVDNGRTLLDRNGNRISTYYHNLRRYLTEHHISYLHYFENYKEQVYDNDFNDFAERNNIKTRALNAFDHGLIRKLRKLENQLTGSRIFSEEEMNHIRSGLTVFFETARLWDYYLQKFKPEKLIILGHYHREGLIYACRSHNVKVIELQHGLIAREDIFYVLPEIYRPIRSRALFADKILTYGNYWSSILKEGAEYSPGQIGEIGYYLYEDPAGTEEEEWLLKKFTEGKKVVLITTQPALHDDFCGYLQRWLSSLSARDNCCFILKLHPADVEHWYNMFEKDPRILLTRIRLEVLFKYANAHVTSYSTTIYDALRYGVRNFSVNFESSSDYVNVITKEGYSQRVSPNEFPNLTDLENTASFPVSDYFAASDLNKILNG